MTNKNESRKEFAKKLYDEYYAKEREADIAIPKKKRGKKRRHDEVLTK